MESQPAVTKETLSTWLLWCGTPVAAVLVSVAPIRLWLTMPVASGSQALSWAFFAEVVVLVAIGAAGRWQTNIDRFVAAVAVLVIAWAAADASIQNLGEDVVLIAILMVTMIGLKHWFQDGVIAFQALAILLTVYHLLA